MISTFRGKEHRAKEAKSIKGLYDALGYSALRSDDYRTAHDYLQHAENIYRQYINKRVDEA